MISADLHSLLVSSVERTPMGVASSAVSVRMQSKSNTQPSLSKSSAGYPAKEDLRNEMLFSIAHRSNGIASDVDQEELAVFF